MPSLPEPRLPRAKSGNNNHSRQASPLNLCIPMLSFIALALPIAAAGYSLLYLLLGGGFFGAVIIFIVAKMLGK